MLGTCSPLPGWDGFRILVGLSLSEDPESGLCEMAGDGADGDGVPLPVAGAGVDLGNVLLGPAGLSVVGGDDIAGFDEGPFEILIGSGPHVPVMGLPPLELTLGVVPA